MAIVSRTSFGVYIDPRRLNTLRTETDLPCLPADDDVASPTASRRERRDPLRKFRGLKGSLTRRRYVRGLADTFMKSCKDLYGRGQRSDSTRTANSPTGSGLVYLTAADFDQRIDGKAPKPEVDVRGMLIHLESEGYAPYPYLRFVFQQNWRKKRT